MAFFYFGKAQVFTAQTVPKLARFSLDESAKKLEPYQTLIRSKTCTLCRSKACTIPRVPWKRKADPWKFMSVHQKTRALKILTKGGQTCFPYPPLLSSKEKALTTRLRLTVTFGHFNNLISNQITFGVTKITDVHTLTRFESSKKTKLFVSQDFIVT